MLLDIFDKNNKTAIYNNFAYGLQETNVIENYYLDYSAEYYHTKANCEAAQLGDVGEKWLHYWVNCAKFLIFKRKFFLKVIV